jgi:DnaK suppressor protein
MIEAHQNCERGSPIPVNFPGKHVLATRRIVEPLCSPRALSSRRRSPPMDRNELAHEQAFQNRGWLDMVGESAYTTEFLDGNKSTLRGGASKERETSMAGTRTRAGMDKKRLEYYKKKLLARRDELMRTIARTQEEGRTADEDPTVDLADKAANSYTKEFLFGMTNTDRTILNMIDAALKRIQADEYGVCANCQEEMQQKRLEAVPWAKHCIACQEKMEQGLL